MNKISGKHFLYGFLTIYFLFQFYILLFSKSAYGYGGADNIAHYQIARFAFRYPHLFLDLWGKPVFTTLLAPFAQFGFNAAKFFNLLVALATLWVTAQISEKLYRGSGIFATLLLAFTPVFLHLGTSCLTEMLFAFVLTAAVFLFLNDRPALSAALISFIPYVRSEGVILLPIFAVALLLKKSYRSLLFLAAGTLFYTLLGVIAFGDPFWLITHSPYSMGDSFYGSGSILHFFRERNEIFGAPLVWLTVAGLAYMVFDLFRKFSLRKPETITFILIAGTWITFFAAHSYVWWRGTGASLGLIRVMGGVAPMVVLTGMALFKPATMPALRKWIAPLLFGIIALFQVSLFFRNQKLLLEADPTEQLVKKAADFIRFNEEDKKIFYFNPLIIHYLDRDPYDTRQCNWWVADKVQPSNTLDWGDLLVWDAHFGPNEGGVTLENLMSDPFLKEIKAFYPLEKITVLGGYDYSIHLFKKTPDKGGSRPESGRLERVLSFEGYDDPRVMAEDSLMVWVMDPGQEYSPTMVILPEEFERYEIVEARVTVNYEAKETLGQDELFLVFSVDAEGKNLRYEAAALIASGGAPTSGELSVKMSAAIPAGAQIKVYLWNPKGHTIKLESLRTEISSY